MTEVGVRALRNHLSRYLQLVRRGERIVVTRRGRPVALLTGLEPGGTVAGAWKMVERGEASWGGGKLLGSRNALRNRAKSADEMVIEDRR